MDGGDALGRAAGPVGRGMQAGGVPTLSWPDQGPGWAGGRHPTPSRDRVCRFLFSDCQVLLGSVNITRSLNFARSAWRTLVQSSPSISDSGTKAGNRVPWLFNDGGRTRTQGSDLFRRPPCYPTAPARGDWRLIAPDPNASQKGSLLRSPQLQTSCLRGELQRIRGPGLWCTSSI